MPGENKRVRPPAVAGYFYPADPDVVRADAQALLNAALGSAIAAQDAQAPGQTWPKAIITPHAGWQWSGDLAALAWQTFAPGRGTISRVVLLGPTHRVPIKGVALPEADAFASPLGTLPIPHRDVAAQVAHRGALVGLHDDTHRDEHALEVQVPFIQLVLGEVEVVPINVGRASADQVADVIEALWGGEETVIAVSSDLSHYLPSDVARHIDAVTIAQILNLEGPLDYEQACGANPVSGLMEAARRRALVPRLLAAKNSGDVSGDEDRVVGYAAFAFDQATPSSRVDVPSGLGEVLTGIARAAITQSVTGDTASDLGDPAHASAIETDPAIEGALADPGATFVTLTIDGLLRGCIGTLEAWRPLGEDVADNAVSAALHDPRFEPVSAAELDSIDVEVSVLSAPEPLEVDSLAEAIAALQPGIDGVIVRDGRHRATFLPQVWEQLPQAEEFLAHLWRKAGLRPGHWSPATTMETYRVTAYHEG